MRKKKPIHRLLILAHVQTPSLIKILVFLTLPLYNIIPPRLSSSLHSVKHDEMK